MNINKPTEEEKERSIQTILAEGLQEPESIKAFFMRMYQTFGFKYIFYNLNQVMTLSIGLCIGFMLLFMVNVSHYPYSMMFLLSPFSFITILTVTEWMERSHPLFELKMTFKYTVKDLVVFRILFYSLISVFVTVLFSLGMGSMMETLKALSIAFSSLFFCTLLTVTIARRFTHRFLHLTSWGVWGVANVIPFLIFKSRWEMLLINIPLALTIFVSAGLLLLYAKEMKKIINVKNREVDYDVASESRD